jgi:hypothetical protein
LPIRVTLIDLPQLLSEIVTDMLGQAPGFTLAAEGTSPEGVDLVIVGARGDELPEAGRDQLAQRPESRALAIGEDGRRAYLFELRPHRTLLLELSADTLRSVLRTRTEWA